MAVDVKPKRRNSEKRKEKSRDAARTRRSKETEIFSQLAHQLPISQNTLALLDKSSIVRLGITHLKLRQLFRKAAFAKSTRMLTSLPSCHLKGVDHLFCRALDGFLMLVNKDGTLVFATDNVNSHLGLAQVDLLGLSIYDFIHPCDHDEVQDILSNRNVEARFRSQPIFLRMKCTLTSKGHSINIKSAYYKVIHCLPSTISPDQHQMEPQNLSKVEDCWMSFTLLLCRSLFHPTSTDMRLDSKTFVSHHNMDMSFVYCDERFGALLGYKTRQLLGKSLYNFHHVLDDEAIEKSYKTLFSKGQCVTGLYRFLVNGGGYIWVETQASVISNPRAEKEQLVVCIHFVVSEVECRDQIFSSVQQSNFSIAELEEPQDLLEADEIDEVSIDDDDDDDDEDGDAEMDDSAIFMTEQILKFAVNHPHLDSGHKMSPNCEFSSGKKPISYRSPAIEAPIVTDYRHLAPFISMEDTSFATMTTNKETSVESIIVDPDLDQELGLRSENPLLMHFHDMTYSGNKPTMIKPLHCLNYSMKDTATAIPTSGFRSKLARFPAEESEEFGFVGDVASMLNGSSVLKNLLLKGEDTNYGYRLLEAPTVLSAAVCRKV